MRLDFSFCSKFSWLILQKCQGYPNLISETKSGSESEASLLQVPFRFRFKGGRNIHYLILKPYFQLNQDY